MKTQYANSIKSLSWLDDPVRAYALKKLDAVGTLLGFPQKVSVARAFAFFLFSPPSRLVTR